MSVGIRGISQKCLWELAGLVKNVDMSMGAEKSVSAGVDEIS